MSYQRLAYDDAASTAEMSSDCRAVEEVLSLPAMDSGADPAGSCTGPASGVRVPVLVSDATAELAGRFLD